jgi:hypothetical protein
MGLGFAGHQCRYRSIQLSASTTANIHPLGTRGEAVEQFRQSAFFQAKKLLKLS